MAARACISTDAHDNKNRNRDAHRLCSSNGSGWNPAGLFRWDWFWTSKKDPDRTDEEQRLSDLSLRKATRFLQDHRRGAACAQEPRVTLFMSFIGEIWLRILAVNTDLVAKFYCSGICTQFGGKPQIWSGRVSVGWWSNVTVLGCTTAAVHKSSLLFHLPTTTARWHVLSSPASPLLQI